MLGPNICSFLFKLLHQILPTAQRVSRILPNQTENCSRCHLATQENLNHALFECPSNNGVGNILLQGLRKFDQTITPTKIISLDYEFEEEIVVRVTGSFLSALWQLRVEKKRVDLVKIRSEMEANCRLLRESRLEKTTEILAKIF